MEASNTNPHGKKRFIYVGDGELAVAPWARIQAGMELATSRKADKKDPFLVNATTTDQLKHAKRKNTKTTS